MSNSLPTPERVDITCEDGTVLAGHFVPATATPEGARPLPVLICPATGVRQQFYLRFAAWLAEQGHDVLVFDYRGVGLSLKGPLKACRATLTEWGQQDQVAALAWLLARTGQPQVLLVGHSAGGQMIGLLPNHDRIARVVGVAASTGWFKGMRPGFRMQAHLAFKAILPLGIRLKGYAPCSRIGLGEDLPAAVATEWGRWCAAGGYATNAVKRQPERDFHARVRTPVTVLHATDDDIATPATVADLLRTWPQADTRAVRVSPREHGLKAIGHINWFRSSHQALWPLIGQALRGGANGAESG